MPANISPVFARQRLPVDQDREIRFLKQALDETTQAKQQPIEQMARMQKVLDAWQSQATTAQQELDGAMQDAAALRARVAALEAAVRQAEEGSARLQGALDQVPTACAKDCASTPCGV